MYNGSKHYGDINILCNKLIHLITNTEDISLLYSKVSKHLLIGWHIMKGNSLKKKKDTVFSKDMTFILKNDSSIVCNSLPVCIQYSLSNFLNSNMLTDDQWARDIYQKLITILSTAQIALLMSITIERKDRKYKIIHKYSDCFIGKEAVDFLVRNHICKSRKRAVILGQKCLENGFMRHVVDDLKFQDKQLWYNFIDSVIKIAVFTDSSAVKKTNINNSVQIDDETMHKKEIKRKIDDESLELNGNELKHNGIQEESEVKAVEYVSEKNVFAALKYKLEQRALTVVIFGATGHLARTKTFPALFALFIKGCFPDNVRFIGYGRRGQTVKQYHIQVSKKLGNITDANVQKFLKLNRYVQGKSYADDNSFQHLNDVICAEEDECYNGQSSRLIYLATPPFVFVDICKGIRKHLYLNETQNGGWLRVIVEKPFGRDLQSSNELAVNLAKELKQSQLYRIDHYLAKELIQNIIAFRFSNILWEAIWNRNYVKCVKISMREVVCLDGRGSYYDEYGVIRDVFQNHLLQVLSLIAMEHPISLSAEDVRNEKVKVLKCIQPMNSQRTSVGQYSRALYDESLVGYREEPDIAELNPTSNQITFVQSVLFVNNYRWAQVPFICECGKGLNVKSTRVILQFKSDGLPLYPNAEFNELVIDIQPSQTISLKINNKQPGFSTFENTQSYALELDFGQHMSKAYTRLLFDALKGDQSLFVGDDELRESWRIVTPFLLDLERTNADPVKYPRGSYGPSAANEIAQTFGFRQSSKI